MNTLERITTEYVELEDRFRLSGEYENGQIIVLWLTQRLLVRLLPHLFKWLETQSAGPIPQDIVQSLELEAANAERGHEAPVPSAADSLQCLVHSVDISPGSRILSVQFRASPEMSGQLHLNAQQLRQWLSILHALWKTAEWPSGIWPEWIATSALKSEESKRFYH